jgi:hypothetical protein
MPRNPIGALFIYPVGLALTGAGVVVAGWVGLALVDPERAHDWALWALEHSNLSFATPVAKLAGDMLQSRSLFAEAAFAAFVMFFGVRTLLAGRTALRPANQSQDGKFEIELKTVDPHVGARLDGTIRIAKDPNPGEVYRVSLTCSRSYSPKDEEMKRKDVTDTAFYEQLDVKVVQGARGWSIPFSFSIPATAPVSTARSTVARGVYHWRLAVYRANAWVALGSWFNLSMGAASDAELLACEAAQPHALANLTHLREIP